MRTRVLAVLSLFLPCLAFAVGQDTTAPELRNVVYIHPVQITAMIVASEVKPADYGATWLQADYERYLAPSWSAIGGIQYLNLSAQSSNDANLGFFDALAGARFYPGKRFSGFYLQPQLDYMRIFASSNDDEESWDVGWNRFGVAASLGFNGKWDRISLDWNVGLNLLTSPDGKITKRNKKTGKTEVTNLDDEANETVANVLTSSLSPSTSFAIGYQF